MVEWGELKDMPPEGQPHERINCFHCVYFKTTWDPKFPRGCIIFEFSGVEMPSETVLKTTGKKCPSFKLKQKPS
jgi:Uma2 family endonuclease